MPDLPGDIESRTPRAMLKGMTTHKPKRSCLQYSHRKLFVLSLLFAVAGCCFALWCFWPRQPWWLEVRLSSAAEYDRQHYDKIKRAILADPNYLLGKTLDEVTKQFGMEGIPWDNASFQQPPNWYRVYHFRGFGLFLTVELCQRGSHRRAKGLGQPLTCGKWNITAFGGLQINTLASKSTA